MRKISRKNRAGITLAEIIVTLLVASIVISATAVILIIGQNSLERGWKQVNVHRDAAYSITRIKHAIRCATNAELEEGGNILKIYNGPGWIKYKYVPGQKNLLCQFEGEDEQIIIDGIVESATFVIDPVNNNAITVNIQLKKDDYEVTLSSTTMMRNYGT